MIVGSRGGYPGTKIAGSDTVKKGFYFINIR